VEGFPDSDHHKLCFRCRKWFEPDDGSTVHGERWRPFDWLRASAQMPTSGTQVFMCHRCQRVRTATKTVVWSLFAAAVAAALLVGYLGGAIENTPATGDVAPAPEEENDGWKIVPPPPPTAEESREAFTRITRLRWPASAELVRHGARRAPLLGDGETYVVFLLDSGTIREWRTNPPPWGGEQWGIGPVSPEIGTHCGFGLDSPSMFTRKGGKPQYDGGAPEVRAVLSSKDVVYVARSRAPDIGPPWHNGDLLLLDVQSGKVWLSSWGM